MFSLQGPKYLKKFSCLGTAALKEVTTQLQQHHFHDETAKYILPKKKSN